MELAQLISPNGEWGKVWLAAHWDKKLKKQDYLEADICRLVAAFRARHSLVSLRAIGHLVLGACKIIARKAQLFEEEANEVRTRLTLVFSNLLDPKAAAAEAEGAGASAAGAGVAALQLRLLHEMDPERLEVRGEETLMRGMRHMARLEDITLKEPAAAQAAAAAAAGGPGLESGDLFGAMSSAELESAMKELQELMFPGFDPKSLHDLGAAGGDFGTQPLVALEDAPARGHAAAAEAFGAAGAAAAAAAEAGGFAADAADTPMPLELDLAEDQLVPLAPHGGGGPNLLMDGVADLRAPAVAGDEPMDAVVAGEAAADGVVEVVAAKRRRRNYFEYDEVTEIPKETYNEYVNNRSAITRRDMMDYTVTLPHCSPNLPNFTTTFTDLCPELCQVLLSSASASERRRRLAREAEAKAEGDAEAAWRRPPPLPGVEPAERQRGGGELVPSPGPPRGGLPLQLADSPRPGAAGGAAAAAERRPEAPREAEVEAALVAEAPTSMGAVVTGNMDQEDQASNVLARIGYSGRTERMHRFLAREFHDGGSSRHLSYGSLCKQQGECRRDLIAGCFFELLVLKTNGVIGLEQEDAKADIKISKARQFATA